jgi:outer membrane lipoprotein SlyB
MKGIVVNLLAPAVALMAAAGILGGCAYPESFVAHDAPPVERRIEYGVVEKIDLFREGQSAPSALGAILGGVAGGVIGHQIGSGSGNTAATIAGALGGAFVGNQIQHANARDRYRLTVRLDNGARLEITEVGEGELRVGDRVRVVNNRVYRE